MNKKIRNLDWLTVDTFVCSDLHLGHKNIMEFEPQRKVAMEKAGFDNHEEWLIALHNETVGKDDNVLFIGDIAFKGIPEYLHRLNGNKYLIMGNHDKKGTQTYNMLSGVVMGEMILENKHFTLIYEDDDQLFSGIIKRINGEQILFSHYPLFDNDEWDRKNTKIRPRVEKLETFYEDFGCDRNVHGHTHSKESAFESSTNVCLEHIDFKPKRLGELLC